MPLPFSENMFGQTVSGILAPLSVLTEFLADGAVTTVKIAAGAITSNELAGSSVTASKIPDNSVPATKIEQVAWTTWTPTLTQSAAVTKTVGYASYYKIGRMLTFSWYLTATAAGTASNAIRVSIPVYTAAYANDNIVGSGYVYDASANVVYGGPVTMFSTTEVAFYVGSGAVANRLGIAGMTAALANGDVITGTATVQTTT